MNVRVALAAPAHRQAAQAFYDFCGYGGSAIAAPDIVVLAWQLDRIVGVGRLCHEEGALCLRGMQVHPAHRREGLGTRLLQRLTEAMGTSPCYCLPYRHLEDFYARAGFRIVGEPLPALLHGRLADNRRRGLDVIAMLRPGGSAAAT